MKCLDVFIEKAWLAGTISDEWKQAEGIFMPKEKNSRDPKQFRLISLLRERSYLPPWPKDMLQCRKEIFRASIEHATMIWEAIQRAKQNRLSHFDVWLVLANAYGSVPHQLIWRAPGTHHVPKPVIQILQNYFDGFEMWFTTKTFTTRRLYRLALPWVAPPCPPSSYWPSMSFSKQRSHSKGACRRGSAHAPNQGIYGRYHPHHKTGDTKNYK